MKKRKTARVILLNPENQIYLMKIKPSNISEKNLEANKSFWVTIGGGIENDESIEEALHRELFEETGIRDAVIRQPAVWYGEIILTCDGEDVLFCENFYVAYSKNSDISHDGLFEEERNVLCDYKWWGLDELQKSTEIFVPQNLHELLSDIIMNLGVIHETKIIDLSIQQ